MGYDKKTDKPSYIIDNQRIEFYFDTPIYYPYIDWRPGSDNDKIKGNR